MIHQGFELRRLFRGTSSSRAIGALFGTVVALLPASCATGSVGESGGEMEVSSEAEWRQLASPRPAPLPGAVRLAFAGIELPTETPWAVQGPVPVELGLSELVVAGLLRRQDVAFVERRRFGAAVEAERGGARERGAPAAGVSPGSEITARAVWVSLLAGQATLEIRLTDTGTGANVGARRVALPADTDLVASARAVVSGILATLREAGRLPTWNDPFPSAAPATPAPSGVPLGAVERFLAGLGAEERWNWEVARRSYQAAAEGGAFLEAEVALARTARLRNGGTLGES